MQALAERLKLSKAEAERLQLWALAPTIEPDSERRGTGKKALSRRIGRPIVDRLRLSLASARARAAEDNDALIEAGGYSRLLTFAEKWKKPKFPLKGADLSGDRRALPGPKLGKLLKQLEEEWIESGFQARSRRAARARRASI